MNRFRQFLTSVALAALVLVPVAASRGEASLVKVSVFPADVSLETSRDRQSLVVQALFSDGITRDVTTEAKYSFVNAALVKFEKNTVYPVADGATECKVEFGGQTVTVPVKVAQATVDRPISFKLDVMPVFMRTGCNTGSCHGAARGKDGFRLSLFGFDPDGDHYRLTREINGRRINLAIPGEGLLMEKGCGKVPHTGGQRIVEGDEYYQTLIRWHDAGAPNDPANIPQPISLEVYPKNGVMDGKGATQKMTVRAKYSDGTDRDVTSLCLFMSNNDNSAKVTPDGVITANERGEAFVMARFATFTVGSPFIVLPKGLQFNFPQVPENNYIDTLVFAKLKNLRIAPSELCSDEVFIRRVTLDICGVLPTPEEYTKFMSDPAPNKREKLVDELLNRKEFAELWVLKWAELLQIRSSNEVSYKAMLLYFNWLQDKIARNVPVNEWVQELLAANGGTFKMPATNYYQTERDVLKVTENVAQVFMGMRIQCAQCHNHPFDRWTMDDYYGFASFFTQIGRKGTDDPREIVVFNSGGGEVNHPVVNRPLPPKFLGGEAPAAAGKDRRALLAKWLASPENPYFATNLSNIVWAHFFGQGIIHEVDDVRISNPPSNGELLNELGKRFTDYKYDFKKLVRDICTSRTYQLSTQANPSNESDTRNFAKGGIRRIRAETMLDCITMVTETKNKFPGLPLGARAVQIADGQVSNYFLTTFGRATRETVCSCEVKLEPTLSQSLHLLNGDATSSRIQQGNLIGRRLAEKKAPEAIIEELYLRTVTRKPTPAEVTKLMAAVNAEPNKQKILEDVFWALLNSREFMFNH
ncbi:DUF1549 and DUF1553 domain-containing protein [Tuwongella immobilis]|uniref:Cell surface protein n=1 Tax=Tuwongella immobilis TaxID=692036 RepID=A0A6C2YTB1_9BACT|nr:DUF1549 and DUF1553 domain-containing protein [Tuwongella immobilis]VIP04122.1 Uncharacterized protein OS=Planctomyces maris DSM 8797 GN=PM8797T_03960 PE=4 SV=1: Big_2: PSCyt2: PSD1 [Tuwongella immobilis]VTS05609.1 Uncharacterized protein OS=Planctomyces maris DSM 8797 GN=PM8797T_03960 PE=4 SV=1: Big_2: PSCyt2: PSD1 [Tuwongella immobilis]